MHHDQPPKEIEDEEPHNFKFYCKHQNFAKIIGNRKLIFGSWGLIGYIGQFVLIVSCLNVYSDDARFLTCDPNYGPGHVAHSEVYDTALLLLTIYHIIEWVRMTMFLVTLVLG